MTITPHVFAGAAVASATTTNIFLAFLLGFLSHFLLDILPHVDPGTFHNVKIPGLAKTINLETIHAEDKPWPRWIYIFVIFEFIFAWGLMILLFKSRVDFSVIVAGGFGAIAVDVLDNPIFDPILRWPIFRQIHWLHHKFHYDLPTGKWYWGLPAEIIILGVSLWYLLRF